MITLFWADGTLSLCQTLQNPFGGWHTACFTDLSSCSHQPKNHHQSVDWIYTATFQGFSLVLTVSNHHHQLVLCQYFQHCLSFNYATSILRHSSEKRKNRNNVVQDPYHTATTKKRQKLIQEVLPMVLLPQALVLNFFSVYFCTFSP